MKRLTPIFLVCSLLGFPAFADPPRDGSHDFDFALGTFHTHIKRLLKPLSGSTAWVEYDGTKTDRALFGGKASLEEIEADGPAGHLEFMTLRLYNPASRQWSLNFSASGDGALAAPSIGEFKDDVGTFMDQENYNGRVILVRNIWSGITANSYHFLQAFSADQGKTWETNFTADLTRSAGR